MAHRGRPYPVLIDRDATHLMQPGFLLPERVVVVVNEQAGTWFDELSPYFPLVLSQGFWDRGALSVFYALTIDIGGVIWQIEVNYGWFMTLQEFVWGVTIFRDTDFLSQGIFQQPVTYGLLIPPPLPNLRADFPGQWYKTGNSWQIAIEAKGY